MSGLPVTNLPGQPTHVGIQNDANTAYGGKIDVPAPGGHVLTVGAGQEFATISAAVNASHDGDVIAIQPGTYTNDFSILRSKVTIEGIGGMVNLVATIPPPDLKGIFTTETDVTIKNISFSGSAIDQPNGGNGAGIRGDQGSITVSNCVFHDNQDGILADSGAGSIIIDHSEFYHNGSGTGYTHDIYVHGYQFTLTNSVIASAVVGHEVKSRDLNNTISNNIIEDGSTGTGSYVIDLPNGGNASVTGNWIEKGPNAQNNVTVTYGEEGLPFVNNSFSFTGNTIVNDHGGSAIAVRNADNQPLALTPFDVSGNKFVGFGSANLVTGAATGSKNVDGNGNALPDFSSNNINPNGNTKIFTDNLAHTVTLTAFNQGVVGGGGLLTVYSAWGHEIAIGGSGGLNYTDTSPDGQEWATHIITLKGSTNQINVKGGDTIDSRGNDTVHLGSGNTTVNVAGQALVYNGTGNDIFTVLGTATIIGGGGSDAITLGKGANLTVNGALSYMALNYNQSSFNYNLSVAGEHMAGTISGGAGSFQTYNGTDGKPEIALTTASGSGAGSTIRSYYGNSQITSNGNDNIYIGAGNSTVIVSASANIYAGSGSLAVYGHGETGVATIYGSAAPILISGDSGGITYIGSNQAATVTDDLSHTSITGKGGHLTITGRGFNRTITGGWGGIDVVNSAGGDVISTWAGATDHISLQGGATINSAGNDLIQGNQSGNITVTASGNSTIYGSNGNSHYNLNGSEVFYGSAGDWVTVGAKAHAVLHLSGTLETITDQGGSIVYDYAKSGISFGGSLQSSNAGIVIRHDQYGTSLGAAIQTAVGSHGTIQLGSGNDVVNSGGSDTITLGNGNATLNLNGSNPNSVDIIVVNAAAAPRTITINGFNSSVDSFQFNHFNSNPVADQSVGSAGLTVNLTDGTRLLIAGYHSQIANLGHSSSAVDVTTAAARLTQNIAAFSGNVDGLAANVANHHDTTSHMLIAHA